MRKDHQRMELNYYIKSKKLLKMPPDKATYIKETLIMKMLNRTTPPWILQRLQE